MKVQPKPLTESIFLRDVVEADLPILFEYQREPDACRMASFPAREREAFLVHWNRILFDPDVFVQAILVDDRLAGNVVCWESEGRPLVGYWIGKQWWGRGIASAGLQAFLARLSIRPLYARVAKDNVASIRVLEKCGFRRCRGQTETSSALSDSVEEWMYWLECNSADRM